MISRNSFHPTRLPRVLAAAAVGVVLGALVACDGDSGSGPTASSAPLVVQQATVAVDGRVVSGASLTRDQLRGGTARFSCELYEVGAARPGGEVWVAYDGPHSMGRMRDRIHLRDDGLGCDLIAADGRYCYEDHEGEYGPHHDHALAGQYHYEFWGQYRGSESGHVMVTVTMTD